MGLLWDRRAILTFGPKGSEGKRVEGLRINFEIEKTSKSNPNTTKIRVYNLNEDSKGILKTKEDLTVILEIGYGSDIDQVFIGDIERSFTQRKGADFITTIEADDGGQALAEAKLDKSYVAGTNLKTVIDDALKSMKNAGSIIVGAVTNIKDEIVQNGITVTGLSKTIVDNIASKQGMEFSIQDNEAQILDPEKDTGESAIFLTPSTGLIGSPSLGLIGKKASKVEGIIFKALIQTTKFRPGRAVQIESKDFTGLTRISKVRFNGDTDAPAWFVNCEATIL